MSLGIPQHPHHPLAVKRDAQEVMETHLLALADFLCSNALKIYNSSRDLASRHIALAHGGKAFSEYVEKAHRPDSFDWDVKIYIENTVMPDRIDAIQKATAEEMADIINRKLAYMYTVKYAIHKAIQACKMLNGFNDPRVGDLDVSSCGVRAYNGRRTAGSGGGTVDYVCLCVDVEGAPVNIVTLMETWAVIESADTIRSYYRASKQCIKLQMHLLDGKRYMSPYKYVKDNIRTMITTPTYPKKEKARNRLRILEDAEANQYLNCAVQPREACLDAVAFDFTRGQPWFVPTVNISEAHIQRDYDALTGRMLDAILDYTFDGYRPINSALLQSQFFGKRIAIPERIKRLDDCFDAMNALPPVEYDDPLILYRHTGYVDLSIVGDDTSLTPNLYTLAPGTIIENTIFVSTCYTNSNKALSLFVDDSQFRGCMFRIKARSSQGLIVIDKRSRFPEEREVLLDRRGHLVVTRVSFAYIIEECRNVPTYMERLLIDAYYLPYRPAVPSTSALGSIVAASNANAATGAPTASWALFADVRNREISPDVQYCTANHVRLSADEAIQARDLGFPVYPIDSEFQMLQRARDYVDLARVDDSTATVAVDTVMGTLRVPVEFRREDLSRVSDSPDVGVPRRVYNWVVFRVTLSVLIVLLLLFILAVVGVGIWLVVKNT